MTIRLRMACGLLALAWPGWSAWADCPAGAARGRVESLNRERPEDVLLFPRGASAGIALAPRQLLCPGDTVLVQSDSASVDLLLAGRARPRRVTRQTGRVTIEGSTGWRPLEWVERRVGRLSWLFGYEPPRPGRTLSRGLGGPLSQVRGAASQARPLRRHPLLERESQLLPEDVEHAALLWSGAAARVRFGPSGSEELIVLGSHAAIVPRRDTASRTDFEILPSRGEGISYRVRYVPRTQIPAPPGAGTGEDQSSYRLGRALWLLEDGPSNWRLFAVGEIFALKDELFGADRLWLALLSGQPLDLSGGRD